MTIKVTCEVDIPQDIANRATADDIQNWLEFNLGANGMLEPSPISQQYFEAKAFSVDWEYQ